MKIKVSAVCNKCGDFAKVVKDGDWYVYGEMECKCGGRYKIQLDKDSEL